jgi:hypothetical protein
LVYFFKSLWFSLHIPFKNSNFLNYDGRKVLRVIEKVLLIKESGILPFYINQEKELEIDRQLLSGFCVAVNSVAKELSDYIDLILMKDNYKIVFEEFYHSSGDKYLMAFFCKKAGIDEAIRNKMKFIFEKYLCEYSIPDDSEIKDDDLEQIVKDIINDTHLRNLIEEKMDVISTILGSILDNDENKIHAFALTSSTNNLLYLDGNQEILKYRENVDLKTVIEEYLSIWNIKKIPQADIFHGLELTAGLDTTDFYNTNTKTIGLGINTCINLKEEPNNELILYLFGKNTLMRQTVLNIEEKLQNEIRTG